MNSPRIQTKQFLVFWLKNKDIFWKSKELSPDPAQAELYLVGSFVWNLLLNIPSKNLHLIISTTISSSAKKEIEQQSDFFIHKLIGNLQGITKLQPINKNNIFSLFPLKIFFVISPTTSFQQIHSLQINVTSLYHS